MRIITIIVCFTATIDILIKGNLLDLFITGEFHDPLDVIIRELVKVGHREWEVAVAALYSEVFRNITHDLVLTLEVRLCSLFQVLGTQDQHQP